MVTGRNGRDSHDYFMLPRGQPQKRQGSLPGIDMQQNLVHLPSIAQQHPVTIKSQQSILGNGGSMGVSLLETVAINRNRPSPSNNIPIVAKNGSPMMVPSVALLGSVPSYRQMTTTESLGAGFYRPRSVAKAADLQPRRAPFRPQTQPPVQHPVKEPAPVKSSIQRARTEHQGNWAGTHDYLGKDGYSRSNGGLISRGNSIPKLLPKVPSGVRNQAPLRQRLGGVSDITPGVYKLKVPNEGLAQFGSRGQTPQDGTFGAAIGRGPVLTPPPDRQPPGTSRSVLESSPVTNDQTAGPKSRGEPFGRSTLDMGRGQIAFSDNKVAARENYGIRGSYNPHAFLSPSRGGPRDVSPPGVGRQDMLRASHESYNSPMLSSSYLKNKAVISPVLGSGNNNRRARSRPVEASQKTSKQIKQRRAGGRSTVLAMGQPNPADLLQRMEDHRKREPQGPLPSSHPTGAAHTTITSRPTLVNDNSEKPLKEHRHIGMPIPSGQPPAPPFRAPSSNQLPVQHSKSQPVQEFESSLSPAPLPWGGSTAPPAVLQDPIPQPLPASPMVAAPDPVLRPMAAAALQEAEPEEQNTEVAPTEPEHLEVTQPESPPEEPQAAVLETPEAPAAKEEVESVAPADDRGEPLSEEAPAEAPAEVVQETPPPAEAQAQALPTDEPMVEEEAAPAGAPPLQAEDEPVVDSTASEGEQMDSEEAAPRAENPEATTVQAKDEQMEQAQPSAEEEFHKAALEAGSTPEETANADQGIDQVAEDDVVSEFSSNAEDCTNLMVAPMDDEEMDDITSAVMEHFGSDDMLDNSEPPSPSNVRVLNDCYEVIQVVGEGAYGLVMKCKMKAKDTYVAIKEFKIEDDDPDADDVRRTSQREVELLRELQHPHVVGFIEDFYVKDRLFIVMEFVPCNLLEVLESHHSGLDREMIRSVMFQLITAITFIHNRNIVYRDIKPENLLVTSSGQIKLCDFGFARHVNRPDETLTDYVATRWYRAPELLLGPPWKESGSVVPLPYGPGVDMWAIGCLMGELVDGEPLFAGDSDIDQLYKIQKIQGSVPEHQWDLFTRNPNNTGIVFNVKDPLTLRKRYEGKLDEVELDFMEGLLALDPAKRLTGPQCLEHPYLKGMTQGASAT